MDAVRPREANLGGVELVERDAERRALDAVLRAPGGVALLEGDGGIGKTTLLDEAAALAGAAGRRVLRASGHELEEHVALGVVHQLLAPAVAALPENDRTALFHGSAALAEGLFTGGAVHPESVAYGLQWVVSGLGGRLALLVDDAHLADPASVRALVHLARRVDELELAIAVATRSPPRTPTGDLVRRLRALPGTVVLRPAPLSRSGVSSIVAAAGLAGAAPAFVDACGAATEGNPLYLRELLLVVAGREIPATDEGAAAIRELGPVAVAEAVFLTLDRLGPQATDLARAIAVLGAGCRPVDAAALAGVEPGVAARLAGAMQRDGLLARGDTLRFVHPIVATAIAVELTDLERDHAHASAARVLAGAGADPATVSSHLLRCSPGGDPAMADRLEAAAAQAIDRAEPGSAAVLLARALAEHDRPATRVALAQAAAAAGDASAPERFADAIAVAAAGEERARLQLGLGRALFARGRYADAAAAFVDGLAELGADGPADAQPGAGPLADELRAAWASAAMWLPDEGGRVLQQAQRTILAIEHPATGGERVALTQLAGGMLLRGTARETALDLARRAWEDGAMLAQLGPEQAATFTASAVLADGDALDEALAVVEAIEDAARARGLLMPAATAAYVRGSYLMLLGDLPGAGAAADSALAAEALGWGQYAAGARWVAATVARQRGDLEAAAAALILPPERERELAQGIDYGALELARGELFLQRGDAAAATQHLEDAAERGRALGVCIGRYNWRPALVLARRAAGDLDGAAALAAENLSLAREWGAPQALCAALRAHAAATPDRALALLDEAARHAARTTDRIERLRVTLAHGHALAAARDADAARQALGDALDLADRCGATLFADDARAGLRALGLRPRRARRSGADALTPGELRVARLAADGRTNREIAELLFVTPKAVKWHLGNAYRKLGVSGRAELPKALDGAR